MSDTLDVLVSVVGFSPFTTSKAVKEVRKVKPEVTPSEIRKLIRYPMFRLTYKGWVINPSSKESNEQ